MKKKRFLFICIFLFSLSLCFAKRTPPPQVPSIIHNKYEYIADYKSGLLSGKGVIIIKNIDTSEIVKTITIYKNWYNPFLEKDVQWIFIKDMKMIDNNKIRIYNEREKGFEINLENFKVTKIKK